MNEGTWFVATICAVLLGIAALTVGVMAGVWHGMHVSCLRLQEQTGYPTRMAGNMFSGGCYLYLDGRWIPEESFRNIGTWVA